MEYFLKVISDFKSEKSALDWAKRLFDNNRIDEPMYDNLVSHIELMNFPMYHY